jgi:hypothetical protein
MQNETGMYKYEEIDILIKEEIEYLKKLEEYGIGEVEDDEEETLVEDARIICNGDYRIEEIEEQIDFEINEENKMKNFEDLKIKQYENEIKNLIKEEKKRILKDELKKIYNEEKRQDLKKILINEEDLILEFDKILKEEKEILLNKETEENKLLDEEIKVLNNKEDIDNEEDEEDSEIKSEENVKSEEYVKNEEIEEENYKIEEISEEEEISYEKIMENIQFINEKLKFKVKNEINIEKNEIKEEKYKYWDEFIRTEEGKIWKRYDNKQMIYYGNKKTKTSQWVIPNDYLIFEKKFESKTIDNKIKIEKPILKIIDFEKIIENIEEKSIEKIDLEKEIEKYQEKTIKIIKDTKNKIKLIKFKNFNSNTKIIFNTEEHQIIYDSLYTIEYMKISFLKFLEKEINEGPFEFILEVNDLNNYIEFLVLEFEFEDYILKYLTLGEKFILSNDIKQINISSQMFSNFKQVYDNSKFYLDNEKNKDVCKILYFIIDKTKLIVFQLSNILTLISSMIKNELYADSVNFYLKISFQDT